MSDSTIKFIKTHTEPPNYFDFAYDSEEKPVVSVEYKTSMFEVIGAKCFTSQAKLTQTICLAYKIDGKFDTVSVNVNEEWLASADSVNYIAFFLTKAIHEKKTAIPNHDAFQKLIAKFVADSISNKVKVTAKIENQSIASLSRNLPGAHSWVAYPCECVTNGYTWIAGYNADGTPVKETIFPETSPLYDVIIHLNDICKWSREKIADWIDELHDSGKINAEFQPWNEDPEKPVEQNPCAEIGVSEAKIYLAPQGGLDGWQEVGYTSDPIEIKFETDPKSLDKIKFNATYHSFGQFSIESSSVIKGDVS